MGTKLQRKMLGKRKKVRRSVIIDPSTQCPRGNQFIPITVCMVYSDRNPQACLGLNCGNYKG